LPSPFIPKVERSRTICSPCGGVGHPFESCWNLHPEKRPAKLGAMSAEPSLISELKSMLKEFERRIPDIVKAILKDAVRKKNSNLGVMNSSSKSKPGNLIYLQGLIGSIRVRVLFDNGASISCINSKFFNS
jgi:hypothetical protein